MAAAVQSSHKHVTTRSQVVINCRLNFRQLWRFHIMMAHEQFNSCAVGPVYVTGAVRPHTPPRSISIIVDVCGWSLIPPHLLFLTLLFHELKDTTLLAKRAAGDMLAIEACTTESGKLQPRAVMKMAIACMASFGELVASMEDMHSIDKTTSVCSSSNNLLSRDCVFSYHKTMHYQNMNCKWHISLACRSIIIMKVRLFCSAFASCTQVSVVLCTVYTGFPFLPEYNSDKPHNIIQFYPHNNHHT